MEARVQPRTQKNRNSRRAYIKRRRRQELLIKITAFAVLIVAIIVGAICIKKFGASKERANLDKYYGINTENQLAVIIDNKVIGAKGISSDGKAYLEYSIVRDYLNGRFYVDMKENLLLYTLAEGTVCAKVGEKEYTFQKKTESRDYTILKMEGNTAYIALDFVQEYTNLEFSLYENPKRVMIVSQWGETTVATVKKDTQVRVKGNVKSAILTDVAKKDRVTVIESKGNWKKVRTTDGVIGYIKAGCLKKEEVNIISRAFEKQTYPNISKDHTINMAWHMVENRSANSVVLETIANANELTTISPTWFMVKNTDGGVTSFASSQYVNFAHQVDLEVWAAVKDSDGGIGSEEETFELLSRTSNRENLINQLISEVLKYKIDGINVYFEHISAECGEHYLQFLRELSLKCRQNEIVLSVNSPISNAGNAQFDLKEQGEVVDYVILMGYEDPGANAYEAAPLAPLSDVETGIEEALKLVPAEKLIHAVPFYTRLWREVAKTEDELKAQEGTEAGKYPNKVSGQAYGMAKIHVAIENAGAEIQKDKKTGLNYAEWVAGDETYKVWLEDLTSLEERLIMMKDHKLAGIAAWRLGFEDSSVWELILKYVN